MGKYFYIDHSLVMDVHTHTHKHTRAHTAQYICGTNDIPTLSLSIGELKQRHGLKVHIMSFCRVCA